MPHRGARHGTVPFHALIPVHDPDSPVGGKHFLGGEKHVVVARPDAYVKLALLAIRIIVIPKAGASGAPMTRFLTAMVATTMLCVFILRGNEEGIGVYESNSQADGMTCRS